MFRMHRSHPLACYEPNAARPIAFFGDLDESDMSMGMAEMLRSNTVLPGLDELDMSLDHDLNLEVSTERGSTSDPSRQDKTTDSKRRRHERLI